MELLLYVLILLVIVSLTLQFWLHSRRGADGLQVQRLEQLSRDIGRLEALLREESRLNREESERSAQHNRRELQLSVDQLREALQVQLSEFNKFQREEAHRQRQQVSEDFRNVEDSFIRSMNLQNSLLREHFEQMGQRQQELVATTDKKLEEVRLTVDEKLTSTLSQRLGESFETVGKQLIAVQQGLGEMQTLATDVGGLKKVLSNVKLRGGLGEVQLAMILEQMLAPGQYDTNVRTKKDSNDLVEFAIKLPGKSDDEANYVYLPIDAKFPRDIYETLMHAYDQGSHEEIEAATRSLEATIRKMARDVRDKYIDPPHTTDFAILFLPFESIYAEVIRRSALVDQLRDEFKITIAGPATLAALLNSIQMGFRTMALQKRSSEVWQVLSAVKSEFVKFGDLLDKARKNLHLASNNVDELMGRRSKAIMRKLSEVQSLPAAETQQLLPDITDDSTDEVVS
jgi:DNA recombination protein RmuC